MPFTNFVTLQYPHSYEPKCISNHPVSYTHLDVYKRQVVDDAAKEMNIQLSDEDKQKIVSLMEKISSLDLDVDSLKEQAKDLYNKLESLDLNINQEQVKGFFDRIVSWCKNIWNSIFG